MIIVLVIFHRIDTWEDLCQDPPHHQNVFGLEDPPKKAVEVTE